MSDPVARQPWHGYRLHSERPMMRRKKLLGSLAFCTIATWLGTACGGDDDPNGLDTNILVSTVTSGDTIDPTGYTVTLDGSESQAIATNAMVTFSDLSAGDHNVKLSDVAVNCAVGGDNPRMLTVTAGSTVPTTFEAMCVAALFDRMAFTSYRDGNNEVYVMNADGTGSVNLTNNAAFDGAPTWSPDGTKIAFVTDRDGNHEVYVMNADGSNPANLTNNVVGDQSPAWSPDGTKIALDTNRDGDFEVYVMNADGSNPMNLTNNAATDVGPAWSPVR